MPGSIFLNDLENYSEEKSAARWVYKWLEKCTQLLFIAHSRTGKNAERVYICICLYFSAVQYIYHFITENRVHHSICRSLQTGLGFGDHIKIQMILRNWSCLSSKTTPNRMFADGNVLLA